MPSNMLFMDTLFPKVTEEDSAKEAIKKILNYQFMLNEQLQYSFYNLGAENFNQVEWDSLTEPIYASIGDTESAITELALTSEGLGLRVSDAEKGIAELTVTAEGLTASVDGLATEFGTLSSQVNIQAGTISSIVANVGANGTVTAASIVQKINSSGSSVMILADKIYMTGSTTFLTADDVGANGHTTINGSLITTGSINANRISGGTINGKNIDVINLNANNIVTGDLVGINLYASNEDDYSEMTSSGLRVYAENELKALLGYNTNFDYENQSLILGNSSPGYVSKYYNGDNMFWIGNGGMNCGILFNFNDLTYELRGTAV